MTITSTPAAFLTGVRTLEIRETPVDEPAEGEVLVRVTAVGLCGSDAHWYEEAGIGDATLDDGLILGHEFAGVIESGPRSGERVAVDPAIPCLACAPCRAGQPNLCLNIRFAGHGRTNGALRGHLPWPERCLVTLPETVSAEQGALLEPLGIALHAIDLAGLDRGDSVGVFGCGPIGLLLVLALRSMGVERVVVTDKLAHRLAAATRLGATHAIEATEDQNEQDAVLDAASGGLDHAIETAGADSALHSALTAVRPGARVVLVGIPGGDHTSFVASLARRKELTLALCRRMLPQDLTRAAGLVGTGAVDLSGMVSHRYSLDRVDEAFRTLSHRDGLKVVVGPGSDE
jgi:L-iditol 2-dehydrogenase